MFTRSPVGANSSSIADTLTASPEGDRLTNVRQTPDWVDTGHTDEVNEELPPESGSESQGDEAVATPEAAEVATPAPPPTALAVILGAGAGSRFTGGGHKLLAKLEGKPLVWWAASHAIDAGFAEVAAIEGSVSLVDVLPPGVSIVRNHDWADGQASSLQVAVHYAAHCGYESVVVGLADQPFVPPEAWRLVAASESPIAMARFATAATPPVRLDADVWGLLPLDGDEGARQIVRARPDLVVEVDCPGSAVDVDTPRELERLRRDPMRFELAAWQ